MLDISSHLIARNRWGNPKDNMIYDIVQNNINDFESFISNVVSVISQKSDAIDKTSLS